MIHYDSDDFCFGKIFRFLLWFMGSKWDQIHPEIMKKLWSTMIPNLWVKPQWNLTKNRWGFESFSVFQADRMRWYLLCVVLVGGDWNMAGLFSFPYIGNGIIISTDELSIIFQRGRSTTNQVVYLS
jgi:hypothetical protein